MTRMTRQELAVRVLLVLDAMPIPERLLHLVCPVWAPIIGILLITTGTNWLMWVSLLLALVGTARSAAEIRREVLDDDNFEWEEISRP
ncbi:hypothetical protein [Nocardiopsis sp. L17-MgMaSL7]|uniref:hypothetical protein n=1 Tax=Nocardiopsis sp. L17-MgMaSL7 TaxID=1938893 RepID=UPI000D7134D5|nr:hypothetical protein [Nocardiopsis sp. L17-MgMaSL7]PWV44556.1 hypothetical protein BDW27_12315 [Nocardiopsis sp. L17-MgMaSL7]